MSFIEKLYHGEYRPMDEETPDNAEFKQAMDIINETSLALCASFSEAQNELWKQHDASVLIVEEQLQQQSFRQGFLIAMEMMSDDDIRERLKNAEMPDL